MSKGFYPKMAWGNIRKNRYIYLPYFLAVSLVLGLCYILLSLRIMVNDSDMRGIRTMTTILNVCVPIAEGFSMVILFYVNSFVMKQRKKEFSLYNILGMEKRHLARLMVMEVLMIALGSLAAGVLGGALFSQLVFLIFYQFIGMPIKLTFTIPFSAVGETVRVFGAGFFLVLVYDVCSVLRTNPIRMLQESRQGEKEPKNRWVLVILGVVTLGSGYWMAQNVENPMEAMSRFFPAALLVVIGTYCLFMAGSIAVLKFMKKRERFYYKPANFISVSGMIYRMKQNAVGLASICILSTTVMATVGSAFSMFAGLKDGVHKEYIRRVMVTSLAYEEEDSLNPNEGKDPGPLMEQAAREHAAKYGLEVKNEIGYFHFSEVFLRTDSGWEMLYGDSAGADTKNLVKFEMLSADDFEKNTGQRLDLKEGEAGCWESAEGLLGESLNLLGFDWKLKKVDQGMEVSTQMGLDFIGQVVQIILPDRAALKEFVEAYEKEYREIFDLQDVSVLMSYLYFFDVDGSTEELGEFYETMRDDFQGVPHLSIVNNRDAVGEEFMQVYGTVMFVGLFLAIIFLAAAVLIIYYKQVTEGYDDRKRFQIMQNVGLSSREVKKTIHTQVLQVFFLPLIVAMLHILAASKAIAAMLSMVSIYNKPLFVLCIGGTAAVFAAIYFLVYGITARTYYKIVKV